jgi:hypothetical protein
LSLTLGTLTFLCLTGEAFDPASGKLLYREQHRDTFTEGHKVAGSARYVDPEGKLLLEKTARYAYSPSAPDMESVDPRSGESTQIRVSQEGVKIDYRAKKDEEFTRSLLLPVPGELVVDEGFSEFIRLKWDALIADEDGQEVEFAVPTRGRTYAFTVQVQKPTSEGANAEVRFRIRVRNVFLRLLVSPLTMTFDARDHRLVRYEGMTNVPDDHGHNYNARIEFPTPAVPCPAAT